MSNGVQGLDQVHLTNKHFFVQILNFHIIDYALYMLQKYGLCYHNYDLHVAILKINRRMTFQLI